jgi:hypothetical protein
MGQIECAYRLYQLRHGSRVNMKETWSPSGIGEWSRYGLELVNGLNQDEIGTFLKLCNREYCGRVWIIQEILLALKYLVICGTRTIEGIYFGNADKLTRLTIEKRDWEPVGSWKNTARNFRYESPGIKILSLVNAPRLKKRYSLHELLRLCSECNSKSEKILDRVYGLLGVLAGRRAAERRGGWPPVGEYRP